MANEGKKQSAEIRRMTLRAKGPKRRAENVGIRVLITLNG
jgi:hypothetical protein